MPRLAAHDPKQAPLSDQICFVENIGMMKPGEGLWSTATTGPGQLGVLQQEGKPAIVAIRSRSRTTSAAHISPSGRE